TQQHASLVRVAEQIELATGGRVTMSVEVGGGIAPATQEFSAVEVGTLDFAVTCFMYWRDRWDECGLFTTVGGGMSPMEALSWFREGGGGEFADEMIAGSGVHIVRDGGWMGPPEIYMGIDEPLEYPNHVQGLTLRGAGDGAEIWERMGASMVMMPAGEVFEAMQRGVIDGYEVSMPTLDWDLGMYEAASYMYLSGARQPYEFNPFIINKDLWHDLPSDIQTIISEVNQTETIRAYAELLRMDQEAIDRFIDYGTNIQVLPEGMEAEYQRAAEEYYAERAAADPWEAQILESYWSWMESLREIWYRI
uniref:TRAP transporter substrate-binding protein DctP n=1 Tax=Desulfonatronospira sp. TaxID=1962951 RepID=UPI0025C360AB